MKKITISFCFLITLFCSGLLAATVNAGFFSLEGKPTSLDSYTAGDKWTVVMFWASDCAVCNAEAHQYVDFYERHKASGVQVLGVSLDGLKNKGDAEQFIARNKISFPNLIIDAEEGVEFYSSHTGQSWVGTPSFMIYAPKGELKAAQVGAVPVKLIEDYIASNSASGG